MNNYSQNAKLFESLSKPVESVNKRVNNSKAVKLVNEAVGCLAMGNLNKFNNKYSKNCVLTDAGCLRSIVKESNGKLQFATIKLTESQLNNYRKASKLKSKVNESWVISCDGKYVASDGYLVDDKDNAEHFSSEETANDRIASYKEEDKQEGRECNYQPEQINESTDICPYCNKPMDQCTCDKDDTDEYVDEFDDPEYENCGSKIKKESVKGKRSKRISESFKDDMEKLVDTLEIPYHNVEFNSDITQLTITDTEGMTADFIKDNILNIFGTDKYEVIDHYPDDSVSILKGVNESIKSKRLRRVSESYYIYCTTDEGDSGYLEDDYEGELVDINNAKSYDLDSAKNLVSNLRSDPMGIGKYEIHDDYGNKVNESKSHKSVKQVIKESVRRRPKFRKLSEKLIKKINKLTENVAEDLGFFKYEDGIYLKEPSDTFESDIERVALVYGTGQWTADRDAEPWWTLTMNTSEDGGKEISFRGKSDYYILDTLKGKSESELITMLKSLGTEWFM